MGTRKILVTNALPFANGPIHLGHLLGYIQADIWVRFQRMRGHKCAYVCADDTHGTAIMLSAERAGVTPEELIAKVQVEHHGDFSSFHVDFDIFYTTHSEENRELSNLIYQRCKETGRIARRSVTQLYDQEKNMFLADRFVKGQCPKCKAEDQYGDNCEECASTYEATELINPRSTLSGTAPVKKTSTHLFFRLPQFADMLKTWTRSGALAPQVANKLSEWLETGLQEWDISRDAPYFGFEIPDEPGKYFYVWLDAPIGYMASFRKLCAERDDLDFDDYWMPGRDAELYHFIGKDIINFHALFWPAMLETAGFKKPDVISVNGFLTVNGQKMSKSRGTFITASTYLKFLPPEALRYYFATRLNDAPDDLDLNLDDFVQRVNSDLVGKLVNIASRTAGFIHKGFGGRLAARLEAGELTAEFQQAAGEIAELYEKRQFARAMRLVMGLADKANQYIAGRQPWALARENPRAEEVQVVCSTGLNLFRLLIIYLRPVLPAMARQAEAFLQIPPLQWEDAKTLLADHEIAAYEPLMTRLQPTAVAAMVEASKSSLAAEDKPALTADSPLAREPLAPEIEYADFAKVDLRIVKIINAEYVEGADKLLKLTLELGPDAAGEPVVRTVFAGIKAAYEPAQLINRHTVMVANLKAREMKFGRSEGMILAAGDGKDIYLLEIDEQAKPGARVT